MQRNIVLPSTEHGLKRSPPHVFCGRSGMVKETLLNTG